jgi:hypothetical protein
MRWSASGFSSRLTQGPAVSVAGRHPTMTGHTDYTTRQVAYDLMTKPGRTRRYHLSPQTAGTIAALLTLREQVIGPILAGVRSPRMGRKPVTWTRVDRDYEKIRIDMQTLFQDLGIRAAG